MTNDTATLGGKVADSDTLAEIGSGIDAMLDRIDAIARDRREIFAAITDAMTRDLAYAEESMRLLNAATAIQRHLRSQYDS